VAGQRVMRYEYNAISPHVIGGSPANSVLSGVRGATISGGGVPLGGDPDFLNEGPNQVTGHYGSVGGGYKNRAALFATVGGGAGNVAGDGSATIGGGCLNTASGGGSTIGGGCGNTSSGFLPSTVGGGESNGATGSYGTVGGGYKNIASGYASMIAGGSNNAASGAHSFAGGRGAKTQTADLTPIVHDGVFIWADQSSQIFDFNSIASNEFAARATGGVRFVTAIDGTGLPTWTCGVGGGAGGSWGCSSDRNLKTDLIPLDGLATLDRLAALPVYQWVAKGDPRRTPHAGPTAQDFMAAFGLGDNDRMIGFADAQGVAFAAIQGLNAKLAQKDREIAELKRAVELLLDRTSPYRRMAEGR